MKAVIFDLDGTLVNTIDDLAAATNQALQKHGFPPKPLADFPMMVGNGIRKLLERALGEACTPDVLDTVQRDFLEIYDQNCMNLSAPYAGMEEVVRRLKTDGWRLMVVTNKPQAQAEKIARYYFGGDTFVSIYGNLEGRPAKPDPLTVHMAMQDAGCTAEETWFVGDSNVDVQTAHNAGLRCIGAVWGFRGEDELKRAGAEILARTPQDILQTVGGK